MIELTIRKHPDDVDMVELVQHKRIKTHSRPDKIRTTVWALVHVDLMSDDPDLVDRLDEAGEIDVAISVVKAEDGGP